MPAFMVGQAVVTINGQLSLIADPVITLTVHRPVKGFEIFLIAHDPHYEAGEVVDSRKYKIPVEKKPAFLVALSAGSSTGTSAGTEGK